MTASRPARADRVVAGAVCALAEKHPPAVERPLEEMADMLTSVIEGGIVLSKVLDDGDILPGQLLQYRDYVRFAFGDNR